MKTEGTLRTIGTKTIGQMWAEIDTEQNPPPPPEDSRTVRKLAERWGCSTESAEHRVRTLVTHGKLKEVGTFTIRDSRGTLRKAMHYLPAT